MKFVPRPLTATRENSSGGDLRGRLKEFGLLAALGLTSFVLLFLAVGLTVDLAVGRISFEREAAIFRHAQHPFIYPVPPPGTEDTQRKQAEDILTRLAFTSPVAPLVYQLDFSSASEPNAFALPGGTIVLTQGLLEEIDDEIGLAFVLAHELGHFAHRDHLRGLGRKLGLRAAVTVLFGSSSDAFTDRLLEFSLLRYSRQQEAAADAFALEVLREAYGTTAGAEALFELLEARDTPPRWAYMFSTHPDNLKRLREINRTKSTDEG